jgi:integrase/recombinase XerD
MSEKPISPLRQRMLDDMNMRRFTLDTQRDYIRAVKKLAAFLGRSPDTATAEDLRAFQLHLTETGVQPPTINTTVTVLRFFFKVTLDRPEITRHLVFVYEPRKLPRVLSCEEVLRLLEAAPSPKHKAALSVAYGAGLRAMEVVALKVSDIDSKRMMLRVEQGKGRKDRFAMLSPQLLELLRDWWRIARPPHLDVSRSRPHQSNDHAPTQSRLPHGGRTGRAAQMGRPARVAAQLRHASA